MIDRVGTSVHEVIVESHSQLYAATRQQYLGRGQSSKLHLSYLVKLLQAVCNLSEYFLDH